MEDNIKIRFANNATGLEAGVYETLTETGQAILSQAGESYVGEKMLLILKKY